MVEEPEKLEGGNSNQVMREGQTVVRKTGPWSPFVHALLRHLTANGFTESPVLHETFEDKERLSFLEGTVGHYPLNAVMKSDEIVIQAAQLLRRFHDLTTTFDMPQDAQFFGLLDLSQPHEVICHNDFAPYNCVFEDQRLVGVIDFDTAAPGTRVWDIAYAVYRFAPLVTDRHCINMGWPTPPDRITRLRLFCEVYGLEDRSTLIETVVQRLEVLMHYMTVYKANVEHLPIYRDDLAYIRANQTLWSEALR